MYGQIVLLILWFLYSELSKKLYEYIITERSINMKKLLHLERAMSKRLQTDIDKINQRILAACLKDKLHVKKLS